MSNLNPKNETTIEALTSEATRPIRVYQHTADSITDEQIKSVWHGAVNDITGRTLMAALNEPMYDGMTWSAESVAEARARCAEILNEREARTTFCRMRPQDMPPHMAGKPHDGWRLRIEREPGENAIISEERVLPERLERPDAQRVEEADVIWLTTDEARWIRDALTELVPIMEAEDAHAQAAVDARKRTGEVKQP